MSCPCYISFILWLSITCNSVVVFSRSPDDGTSFVQTAAAVHMRKHFVAPYCDTAWKDIFITSLEGGLWSSTSSEERIRRYLSALYHEEFEDMSGWRQKWNETEMVYRHIGYLEADDFPVSLRKKWTEFVGGGRKAGRSIPMNVKRKLAPKDSWVEVIRIARPHLGEGKAWANGSCWFYQLEGSGVFINTGRTQAFDLDHADAVAKMREEVPALQSLKWSDAVYTAYAHHKGLDTIQTSHSKSWDGDFPELIYFGGSCRVAPIYGGCVPGLLLRTGFRGNRPCMCKEKVF